MTYHRYLARFLRVQSRTWMRMTSRAWNLSGTDSGSDLHAIPRVWRCRILHLPVWCTDTCQTPWKTLRQSQIAYFPEWAWARQVRPADYHAQPAQ